MNRILKSMFLAGLLAPAGQAMAQEADTGFYAGANVGFSILGDADVDIDDATDTLNSTFDNGSDLTFGGVVGYDFGMIRADVEAQYSRHKVKSLTINSLNGAPVTLTPLDRAAVCSFFEATTCGGTGNTFDLDGVRLRELSAMGNLWVDLPLGPITPYAGGGVGVAGFELEGEGKAKFAWQLGAGVALKLSEKLELTADYRHRQVKNVDVAFDATSGFGIDKLKTNSFTAGVRFRF
jgi:opacity protein-like surface antigen